MPCSRAAAAARADGTPKCGEWCQTHHHSCDFGRGADDRQNTLELLDVTRPNRRRVQAVCGRGSVKRQIACLPATSKLREVGAVKGQHAVAPIVANQVGVVRVVVRWVEVGVGVCILPALCVERDARVGEALDISEQRKPVRVAKGARCCQARNLGIKVAGIAVTAERIRGRGQFGKVLFGCERLDIACRGHGESDDDRREHMLLVDLTRG